MNKYLAELIGTFFLVLTIGCTVVGHGAGPLAPLAIVAADHDRLAHAWTGGERGGHLARYDLVTAGVDHIVDDEQPEPVVLQHAGREDRQVLAFVIGRRDDEYVHVSVSRPPARP